MQTCPHTRIKFLVLASFVLIFSNSADAADFTIPKPVKEKYSYLYGEPIETLADGSLRFHRARLFKRNGIRVLSLAGDRFEMAYQHGRLLRDIIPAGAVPQSALMVENSVRNGFPSIPLITNIVINSFYRKITERMFDYTLANTGTQSEEILLDGYGLSEGAGLPFKTIIYGALGPESLQVLLGEHVHNRLASGVVNQCSAFALWGKHSSDGEMLIGRNTDYPLNGSYDQFPLVIYYSPTNGDQKFMSVSSAGIHNAGVVGLNESGIYIGVHSIPATDVSAEGVPVFFIAQAILRKSRTINEALNSFSRYHPPSGWGYLVASMSEKKAATVELSNHHINILESSGEFHVQTNHYRTAGNTPVALHVNRATDDDSIARMKRVENLIQNRSLPLDVKNITEILGDKVDPFTRKIQTMPNTVAVHTTMTSVVVQPSKKRIFVANGTAPVSQNSYVEFPMVSAFEPEKFSGSTSELISANQFALAYPDLFEGEQRFIKSKIAFESERDYEKSLKWIRAALLKDPQNPAYTLVAAGVALKMRDFSMAETYLQQTQNLPDLHRQFVATYYLGRILAERGKKREAREVFERLSDQLPPEEYKLKKATDSAIQSCKKIWAYSLNTAMLGLMFQEADFLDY